MQFLHRFGAMIQVWFFILGAISVIVGVFTHTTSLVMLALLFAGVSLFGSCLDYCARQEIRESEERIQKIIEIAKKNNLNDSDLIKNILDNDYDE